MKISSVLTRHRPRNRIQPTAVFVIPGVIQPVIRNTKDTGTTSHNRFTINRSDITIIGKTKTGNLGTRCQSSRHTEIVSQRTGLEEIRVSGTDERMHKAFLSHTVEIHPVLPEVTVTNIEEMHGGPHGCLKREGHRQKLEAKIGIDLKTVTWQTLLTEDRVQSTKLHSKIILKGQIKSVTLGLGDKVLIVLERVLRHNQKILPRKPVADSPSAPAIALRIAIMIAIHFFTTVGSTFSLLIINLIEG